MMVKNQRKLLILVPIVSMMFASFSYVNPSFSLGESSYIIDRIGDSWLAQNGTSGTIEFNSTDASTVIQSCIYNMPSNVAGSEGGRILLRSGSYLLNSPLTIDRPDIALEGEGWRSTGLVANFSGDIIRVYSRNDTPYTHNVKIKNMLFYNNDTSLRQTAIYLNIRDQLKLWYVDLEQLYIIGMNGIRTDHVPFGTNTNVLQGWIIRDIFIENAPNFGIDLWATIDVTIDNVQINFAQNTETYPVDNTTGIEITLSGESSGIYIANTRVLRAEYGITITGVRDIWMTNVISDICKSWAFKLNDTTNCILTNIYAHSPTGIGLWITGKSSQNRIIGATIKDCLIGVQDNTSLENPQYFDNVISESTISNSGDWQVKSNDMFTNCNYGLTPQDLQANIDSLNSTVNTLNELLADLESNLTSTSIRIQGQIDYLNQSSILLNQSNTDLQDQLELTNSTIQALGNQINTIQTIVYVLVGLEAVIILAVGFLSIRKPKTKKDSSEHRHTRDALARVFM